ncbi:hypothetical protein BH24CHL6_BH24CHL6_10940 [soil metagenome]
MLRRTWFDPMLDQRSTEQGLRLETTGRLPFAAGLRRPIGRALIELGRAIAAETKPLPRGYRRRA